MAGRHAHAEWGTTNEADLSPVKREGSSGELGAHLASHRLDSPDHQQPVTMPSVHGRGRAPEVGQAVVCLVVLLSCCLDVLCPLVLLPCCRLSCSPCRCPHTRPLVYCVPHHVSMCHDHKLAASQGPAHPLWCALCVDAHGWYVCMCALVCVYVEQDGVQQKHKKLVDSMPMRGMAMGQLVAAVCGGA